MVDYAIIEKRKKNGETLAKIADEMGMKKVTLRVGLSRWRAKNVDLKITPDPPLNVGVDLSKNTPPLVNIQLKKNTPFTPPLNVGNLQKMQREIKTVTSDISRLEDTTTKALTRALVRIKNLEEELVAVRDRLPARRVKGSPRKTPRRDQIITFLKTTHGFVTYNFIAEGLGIERHLVKNTLQGDTSDEIQREKLGGQIHVKLVEKLK